MHAPECIQDCRCITGESPVWSETEGALYWVDIHGCRLYRLHAATGAVREWTLPSYVGSLGLRAAGGLVLALRNGLHRFEPESEALSLIAHPEGDRPGNRFNDGRCDPRGRFWAGTMGAGPERGPTGSLYRFEPDGAWERVRTGLQTPNGLAFSPDERTLYHTDSRTRTVLAFDFDPESGTIGNERPFFSTGPDEGAPDGAAVDTEGCYWSAQFGGWRVARYTPEGRLERIIELPVAQVTMCAFGGPDRRTLYITSASEHFGEADRREQPLAGGLFAVEVDATGLPEPRFAG